MRRDLPSGTVTFLFTDIEGSTKLLHELGEQAYAEALAEHRRVLREAFTRYGGVEVDTQGDAFFVAFPTAPGAIQAATEAQEALSLGPIRVRMGLHTGVPHVGEEGYVGEVVHEGARIAAVGHGGQVLVSNQTLHLTDVEVTDLGEHRLKDIGEPVAIFQLGTGRFPPLKTISNTNLPHPASSFVGRDEEVGKVVSLLRDGARLLTLTGPGGTGKTRLAIEAAAELVPGFKAGVFWVELAPLRDPALVTEEIAQTLGATDALATHIGEREMLLVLDNLEQVIEAAPQLAVLVETCPNLAVLVTSRELLRVRGEVEYAVAPLADLEAVELFCARAHADPEPAVHDLCRALDNLPLALELAAARASALSPGQILERLSGRLDLLKGGRDADPRQQTLRAAIAWSYELLSPEEQRLFARLAVFAGGCMLEAAEDVADADVDTLQSLVDKSLLRHTNERFWMLETIREYALERLEGSGEAAELRRRHAHRFQALAEEAEPHIEDEVLRGGREWLDRLERELDNLRAALDQLAAAGETERASLMVGALSDLWSGRGHVAEGGRRIESALRADERPTEARAKALNGAAELAAIMGDPATMGLRAEEALALHVSLGDRRGEAESLQQLGYAVSEQGDQARAQQLLERSIRLSRDVGAEHLALWTTRTLAWVHAKSGDLERARELYEDDLRRAVALGSRSLEATLLGSLAWLSIREGRGQDALPLLEQSLLIRRDLGDRIEVAMGVCSVARAITAVGNVGTAAGLIAWFDALREEIGGGESWVRRMNEETLTTIRDQLDDAAFAQAWEQGLTLTTDEAVTLALDSLR
ncbi:MAG: adenylate/guanylate cyclase domain-containing protein [Actinomycetota bacterium]